MTVAELREKLKEYPPNLPVIATWEDTFHSFGPERFSVAFSEEEGRDVLLIDVDIIY